jgi:hypothetical protein
MPQRKPRSRRLVALAGAAALAACSRSGEAPASAPRPAPPATPAAPAAALDARDAAALGLPSVTMTRRYAGGRPIAWWSERLERLRREGPEDLYRLTRERARANGLEVVDRPDGGVAVAVAAPAGAGAAGARP